VVIRENTERPEAVEVGGCVLVGNSDVNNILKKTEKLLNKNVVWKNPFGDGESGREIIKMAIKNIF
jgi:UDP-N-acetylglucosamine 2-epimerase (non-hydrolysing)